MLFSPLNMRAPRKLLPNKRQQKARLSNIMMTVFSGLGVIVFWVGFKLRPTNLQPININHPKSKLSTIFQRPQPHLLASHATVAQVDQYVNATKCLGSLRYEESTSCKERGTCEIHFPFVDLESSPQIDLTTTTINSNRPKQHYAVLTRKGYKALVTNVNANQDRAFIVAPLELGQETALPLGPDDFIMGLFDGHGPVGHGTAHFAAMELLPLLLRNMQRRKKFIPAKRATDGIKSALKDSFVHLDENIPYLETSGSTGILILRIGTQLFLASTGDSQAFIVRADFIAGGTDAATKQQSQSSQQQSSLQVSIVQSTVPHKPDQPLESARIRAAGGQVIPKMSDDTSSRVVIPVDNNVAGGDGAAAEDADGGGERVVGEDEILTLALAMSRSLGDPEGKKANVIIADPNVDVIDLEELQQKANADGFTSSKFFVVVASDGLLDKISPLQVAQRIGQSFYQESPPQTLVACQELILQASQLWMSSEEEMEMGYRDDISIAVKMIDL